MNRKEKLKDATLSPPAVWKTFKDRYSKHQALESVNSYLYCFYEGKDDSKYYNIRIKNVSDFNEVSHFIVQGKAKLLHLYSMMLTKKTLYSNARLLFFIDKDFDDLIKKDTFNELKNINNLYITPTYAIENFYTTLQTFKEILKSEFHLIETEDSFQKLTHLFLARQNEFHQILLDTNAWIAMQNYFSYTQEERNIPYNELNAQQFVKITLEKIKTQHDNTINFLENRFAQSFKMQEAGVLEKFEELKSTLHQNPQMNFRGKFELEFLTKFLTLLIEKCNKEGGLSFVGINERFKVQLTLSDTISNLSQYADTPNCLKQFIKINSMEKTQ